MWIEHCLLNIDKIPKKINVYFGADFQLGGTSTDEWVVRNWVRKVAADPNAVWCILGDIEDDDRPTTRILRRGAFAGRKEVLGNDAKKHRSWIDKEIIPLLLPLVKAGRPSMGILAGHHWYDLGEMPSTQYICNALTASGKVKVPYLGQMSAWVKMVIRWKDDGHSGLQRLFHIQHGVGGGRTLAASLNALSRTTEGFAGDVYVRAHDCKLVSGKYDILEPRENKGVGKPSIKHKTITLMNVGSATRGYEITRDQPNYAEMGMMRPQTLGWGVIHIQVYKQSRVYDNNNNVAAEITAEI